MRIVGRWLGHSVARRLLRLGQASAAGASPGAYLERVLSSPRWRAFAELQTWRQGRRAQGKKRRPLLASIRTAGSAADDAPAALLLAKVPVLRDALELLDQVFTAGGYETAERLAEELGQAVLRESPRVRHRALPLFTRVWVTAGAAPRARRLWDTAGADLPLQHPSRQALLLDLGALQAPRWHSDHTFHPYLADACVRVGQLTADELASYLVSHPWTILANAEVELVLHNAVNGGRRDLSAFNRYLERHRLQSIRMSAETSTWLGGLTFSAASPQRGGPLVSVIMSARNAEHTIESAVNSILHQTHRSLELLITDDDSSDGTFQLLRERYAHDARIRLFRSERNQGTYNVRNQLIAHARGDFITFQDADDVSLPTRLARQVASIRRNSGVGAVSEWLRVRPDGSVAFFANGRAARLSIVSLMVSRKALNGVGGYPPAKVGADLDIYRRILQRFGSSSVTRLPTPLLLGLWSDSSLTRSPLSESLESGYRSPARRRYSELVFRRDLFGPDSLPDDKLVEELQQMGNYVAPSALIAG